MSNRASGSAGAAEPTRRVLTANHSRLSDSAHASGHNESSVTHQRIQAESGPAREITCRLPTSPAHESARALDGDPEQCGARLRPRAFALRFMTSSRVPLTSSPRGTQWGSAARSSMVAKRIATGADDPRSANPVRRTATPESPSTVYWPEPEHEKEETRAWHQGRFERRSFRRGSTG